MNKNKRVYTAQERKNKNSNKYNDRKKKYRIRRKDLRNKWRKNNYMRSRPMIREKRRWTEKEIQALNSPKTDRELAKKLNRSAQAIQQKRFKIKNEKV